jgi:sugar phosphate permease
MKQGQDTAGKYRYVVCATIFLSYILVYFHRLCPAVIALDMQEAFQTSGTLLGVLGSAYFYPYAVMQLPVGLLADSWGPRKTVASFLVVACIGSLLMGLSSGFGLAILGRVLVGFGVSTIFVCNFKLLAEWFKTREFAFMGGLFMAAGGIGVLSASAPLAWVSNSMGWRMTLIAVGMITLVMALVVYILVRDKPEDMGLPALYPPEEGMSKGENRSPAGDQASPHGGRFWPLPVYAFCAIGTFFALAGLWAGPYLMHIHGMSKTEAGVVLSMGAFSLIAGSPLLSFLSNVVGRKPIFIGCSSLLIVVFAIFVFFPHGMPILALYPLFFLLQSCGGATGQITATVAKELFPVKIAGTAVGALNFFPFLGGAVFQVLIGAIVSRDEGTETGYSLAGYQHMFLFCAATSFVSLIAACFLTETLPKNIEGSSYEKNHSW